MKTTLEEWILKFNAGEFSPGLDNSVNEETIKTRPELSSEDPAEHKILFPCSRQGRTIGEIYRIDQKAMEAGWLDHFCSTVYLYNHLQEMAKLIKNITRDILLKKYYVSFRNDLKTGVPFDQILLEPINSEDDWKYPTLFINCYFVEDCGRRTSDTCYEIGMKTKGLEVIAFSCKNPFDVLKGLDHALAEFTYDYVIENGAASFFIGDEGCECDFNIDPVTGKWKLERISKCDSTRTYPQWIDCDCSSENAIKDSLKAAWYYFWA